MAENVGSLPGLLALLEEQREEIAESLRTNHPNRSVKALVVKLKFADFVQTTAERAHGEIDAGIYEELLGEAWERGNGREVRLIGAGVRFADPDDGSQLDLGLGE